MSKFQVGDRVRCVDGFAGDYVIETGRICTVSSVDALGYIGVQEEVSPGWRADRFELYAKAGEFVMGDRVVITDADYLADRQMNNAPIPSVLTIRHPIDDEVGSIDPEILWFEGQTWAAKKSRCRLATPDEIADADARPVEGVHYHADLRGSVVHPQSIPAADFDFSTIKAGDHVTIKARLQSDAHGDHFWAEYQTHEGRSAIWLKSSDVHSVIPAPKPETLRERAIEAADLARKGLALSPEAMAHIVDAVLAEVEKSR